MTDLDVTRQMLCAFCGRRRQFPDGFPDPAFAECWSCIWKEHLREFHPPKRRWWRRK